MGKNYSPNNEVSPTTLRYVSSFEFEGPIRKIRLCFGDYCVVRFSINRWQIIRRIIFLTLPDWLHYSSNNFCPTLLETYCKVLICACYTRKMFSKSAFWCHLFFCKAIYAYDHTQVADGPKSRLVCTFLITGTTFTVNLSGFQQFLENFDTYIRM